MPQTIEKATQILDLFSLERPEWGVSEVARALGLPKSTTSELMSGLADQRLLSRRAKGRYRLGWRLFESSQTLLDTTEFRIEASTYVVPTANLTEHLEEENVNLMTCYGPGGLVVRFGKPVFGKEEQGHVPRNDVPHGSDRQPATPAGGEAGHARSGGGRDRPGGAGAHPGPRDPGRDFAAGAVRYRGDNRRGVPAKHLLGPGHRYSGRPE